MIAAIKLSSNQPRDCVFIELSTDKSKRKMRSKMMSKNNLEMFKENNKGTRSISFSKSK